MGLLRLVAVGAFALAAATATAEPGPSGQLALATNLRADGQEARGRKAPVVILFSLPGCPYCEIVRRSHLLPMLRDPKAAPVIVRQIDVDSDQAVVGFDGKATTHAAIARAHDVRAVPVVAFWDGDGRPLADPLRGMLLPDFYSAYLDSAIESARARLAGRR